MSRLIAISLLCASASAQTEILCGPVTRSFADEFKNVSTIETGTFYRLVRCGYSLAASATFYQSGTLLNPGGDLLKVFSAKDENCLNSVTSTVSSDGGLTINSNTPSVPFSGTQESATGDGIMPRVCIYVTCMATTGPCDVASLKIKDYYGRRSTKVASSSSSPSVASTIIGIIIPILICCAIVACVMRARSLRNAQNAAAMGGAPGMGPPVAMAVPAGSYPAYPAYPAYPGAHAANGAGGYPPQPYGGNPYGPKVGMQRESSLRGRVSRISGASPIGNPPPAPRSPLSVRRSVRRTRIRPAVRRAAVPRVRRAALRRAGSE